MSNKPKHAEEIISWEEREKLAKRFPPWADDDPDHMVRRIEAVFMRDLCGRGHHAWYINPSDGRRRCRSCQSEAKRHRRGRATGQR